MLDANLVTVQWGLIGVFGVVVGLLIEPAHRFLQEFLDSGKATDYRRAARWAASLKITSVLVLVGLIGLSVLGAHDAGLGGSVSSTTTLWLLFTPLVAQAGFVILVLCLVKRVPPLLKLPLEAPTVCPSPGGRRDPTIIRFINDMSTEMRVSWLDFEGHRDESVSFAVGAGREEAQSTYEGHVFVVAINDRSVCTVKAAATPGIAIIGPEQVRAAAGTAKSGR
jgi:hypothetical protein